jgi:hypothetical protein
LHSFHLQVQQRPDETSPRVAGWKRHERRSEGDHMTFIDPVDRLMVSSASRSLAVQLALAALLACIAVL